MKFNINTTEQVVKEIDVELPAFFKDKDGRTYVAMFAKDNVVKVTMTDKYFANVSRSTFNILYEPEKIIYWPSTTQGEFNTAFNAAMDLIIQSNLPELKAFPDSEINGHALLVTPVTY